MGFPLLSYPLLVSNICFYSSHYFGNDPDRIAVCTLPLHALLHIADDIAALGPVWCYWAFPMERFCGAIARANKSRRYPYSSINRRVLQVSQLSQIKLMYGLTEELNLEARRSALATGTRYDGYGDLVFVVPSQCKPIQANLVQKVAKAVSDRIRVPEHLIRNALATREFTAWGKMQRIVKSDTGDIVGGDLFRGHYLAPNPNNEGRDASHVQVSFRTGTWQPAFLMYYRD